MNVTLHIGRPFDEARVAEVSNGSQATCARASVMARSRLIVAPGGVLAQAIASIAIAAATARDISGRGPLPDLPR